MNLLYTYNLYTQTFPGQGGLPFPPTGTVGITESIASVSGVGIIGGCVQIDNVTLNMTHTFTGDIAVILIAPDGTTFLELFSQNGGAGDNLQITEFRDDAPINIVSGTPPYNGQFQPEGRQNTTILNPYPNTNPPGTFTFANSFNGINADGDWTLFLNDFVGADLGVLIDWSITFTSNGNQLTVDAGDDETICAGETITLTANASGATMYQWDSGQNTQSINVSPLTTTTYVVTASNGACTGTDEVEVEVLPAPTATEAEIEACNVGNGTGNFNLLPFENQINGGSGLDVNWFSDPGGSNPIANPSNYNSFPGTIYASIGTQPCVSDLVPIELIVNDGPDYTLLDFSASPDEGCGETDVDFFIEHPDLTLYSINISIDPQSGGPLVETWDISGNPNQTYTVDETTVFNIVSINDLVTGCATAVPPGFFLHEIIIESPPEIFINTPDPICDGESIDINDYVVVTGANNVTFHDDTPATPFNEIPSSTVTPTSTTTYYVFAEGNTPGCDSEEPIEIIVNPLVTITLDNSTTCAHDVFDLNSLFTGPVIDGAWNGDGVFGDFLDPTGLSGTVLVSFEPAEDCFLPADAEVEIIPSVIINLDADEVCENGNIIDLQNLQDPSYPDGEWNGPGVSGNNFNPSGLDGEITLTFEGNYQCALPATTTITVNAIIIPVLGLLDYCENEVPYDLNLLEDFNHPGGTWSGDGVSNGEFDPSGLSGEVVLTYEINEDCAVPGETFVNVLALQTPIIDNTYWCSSVGVLNLEEIGDPNFIDGTWSGEGVNNIFFDPTGLSGDIAITFQSSEYCTDEVEFVISLIEAATPTLTSTNVCESETTFDLSVLQDPIFNQGYWSGTGVVGTNQFNAQGLTGTVELEFISTDGCVENAVTTIEIDNVYVPVLSDTLICENVNSLNLALLEDESINAGFWSGPGVSNNVFSPANLSGDILLSFDPSDYCADVATTTVRIQNVALPLLKDSILCNDDQAFDLTLLNADNFTNGSWLGQGIIADTFYPNNLSGNYTLQFVSSESCTDTVATTIQVNETVSVNNINIVCDLPSNTYTVSFDITGGESSTYLVNNVASASQFVSQAIASETAYNFAINDANNCNVVALIGNKNCTCATTAGTMDIPNQVAEVCINDVYTAIHNNDQNLEADTFLFVLHDNPGLTLGTVYGVSDKPQFSFPVNGELGKTYYISAIAGNVLAQFVDLSDPCISVAQGSPVQFYEIKYNTLPSSTICRTSCIDYSLNLQGKAPFTIYAEIKNNNESILDTFISQTVNFDFSICPEAYGLENGVYEFVINRVTDADCETALSASSNMTLITVNPERINTITENICKGDSLVVLGKVYDEDFLSGTEIVASSTGQRCDSIINVDLTLLLPSEIALNKQLCDGETFTINGTEYNENKTSGIEIFSRAAQNGCDSIVNVTLVYTSAITNDISETLCSGRSLTVNGNIYDEVNANGTEILEGGSSGGCDSIINVALSFLPNKNNAIVQTLCRDEALTINGTIYDINNANGSELLVNAAANGCDSLININLSFYPEAKTDIVQKVCKDENLVIEGTTYDINNPSGQLIIPSINGCDSTINVSLSFFNDAIGQKQEFICENDSVVFRGVVFKVGNPTGEFLLQNASANGCDSTLLYKLNFYPVEYDTVKYQIYVGDSLNIDGNILSVQNQEIEYVLFNESQNGCDIRRLLLAEIIKKDVNIVLPNIINPTSGNGNDQFTLTGSEDFIPLEFFIYDRWGNKVFNATAAGGGIKSWDGRLNGNYVLPGVYVYHISYQNSNGEVKALVGDLTVVR